MSVAGAIPSAVPFGSNRRERELLNIHLMCQCLNRIESEHRYLRDHLAEAGGPAGLAAEVGRLNSELHIAYTDSLEEARRLNERLGRAADSPSAGAAPDDPDPDACLRSIRKRMAGAVTAFHPLVQRLDEASKADPTRGGGLLYVLVAECAAHMLTALTELMDPIDSLAAELRRTGRGWGWPVRPAP